MVSGTPKGALNLFDVVVVKVPLACRAVPCARGVECFDPIVARSLVDVALENELTFSGEGAKSEIMHGFQGHQRVHVIPGQVDYQSDGGVVGSSADIEDEPFHSFGHLRVDLSGKSVTIADVQLDVKPVEGLMGLLNSQVDDLREMGLLVARREGILRPKGRDGGV